MGSGLEGQVNGSNTFGQHAGVGSSHRQVQGSQHTPFWTPALGSPSVVPGSMAVGSLSTASSSAPQVFSALGGTRRFYSEEVF